MKTKNKAILLTLCAVLLVAGSVLGTLAYLTAQETVTNTFTVGNVKIKLDEFNVDMYGAKVFTSEAPNGTRNANGNSYRLVPGKTYVKDPTVTVLAESERCYVRMLVTINCAKELDAIFSSDVFKGTTWVTEVKKGEDPAVYEANLTNLFKQYNASAWPLCGETKDTESNTRTYEFRYYGIPSYQAGEEKLPALFTEFTIPSEITSAQLETLKDFKITVEAHAIQADGFADAAAAWAAFDVQHAPASTDN